MNTRTFFLAAALLGAASSAAAQPAEPRLLGRLAAGADSAAPPQSAVERALAEYRATGRARTIPPARPGDFTTYPHGHGRAMLRCAALKLCQIDLQPGETLSDDPLPADRERWEVDQTTQGGTTVVLVRARECDVSTNLLLLTERRRYVVELEVPPCQGTNPRQDYMPGIRFWYPDGPGGGGAAGSAAPLVDASAVNASYRWGVRRGLFGAWIGTRRYPWTPARVVDDGRRTIIRFPAGARNGPMPALYLVGEDGARELVSTTVHPDAGGDHVTVDRVGRRWLLVLREGKREDTVEIFNTARGR